MTNKINLSLIGSYETGVFDEGAAEIPAYDAQSQRLFVINGNDETVDVLDLSDPNNPTLINAIDITSVGASPNSVAVKDGIVAVAIEAEETQDPGKVGFFNADGELLSQVTVGALPDMLTFTPDGTKVLVANEGEPSDDYTNDPEGSVSIIDLAGGVANLTDADVTTAGFTDFNDRQEALTEAGVRIFGPDVSTADPNDTVTVAQDLEPEYIAVSSDSETAYVSLQENNALAKVDISNSEVIDILPLGFKDYSETASLETFLNALDPSDEDGAIDIQNAPVLGMYQPDAIATYEAKDGETYIVTANEGDAREYIVEDEEGNETETFVEEARIADLELDPEAFPNAAELQQEENLGRLLVTTTRGDTDGDGDYDELYAFGGRSFSIWDGEGNLVFDSDSELERITAETVPDFFNSDNDENTFDTRSDDKGPEPEGLATGTIGDRNYAFVGLERVGGVMVYDITEPTNAEFVQYINTRDFEGDVEAGTAGNVGPEGLEFISAVDSPTGVPLLSVAYEISGSTGVFEITTPITEPEPTDEPFTLQLLHAADQEAGVPAIEDAPNFSAVLNGLRDEYENTLVLSSGDAYIPGPFFFASETAYGGSGRADIQIQNELGFSAIAFGNHEFDLGTGTVADLIAADEEDDYPGTNFPYLSSNLDFSTSEDLASLVAEDGQEASEIPNSIAGNTIVTVNGEPIGVVGATTPTLPSIASPEDVTVNPIEFDSTNPDDIAALAAEIQASVDSLLEANPEINKVVLLAHMQQISIEEQLSELLTDVDIIVAGGSNTILADESDRLRAGDEAEGVYPILNTAADGNPIAVVNTDGNYRYVGRLVADFDANGVLIPESIDPEISGAYATDEEGVAAVGGTPNPEIVEITEQVSEVIQEQDGNIFGNTEVFLNGARDDVRTQETNLGNLTADANLAIAQETDSDVVISIKNGGGIRDSIGATVIPPGSNNPDDIQQLPPQANELAGKEEGDISQLDIANSLRFNNGLSLLTVTAEELLEIIEHGVAATESGATPGQFPQVAGVEFSFDPDLEANDRVLSLEVVDGEGNSIDTVVEDGELVGDGSRTFRLVTLNFLADGGDDYPFPDRNRVDLALEEDAARTGEATFAPDGSEQDALAEYLADNFSETSFNNVDTPPEEDTRIQNLLFRDDTVLDGESSNGDGDGEIVVDDVPVLDLTGVEGTANISITVTRDAFYENTVGFFEVESTDGTVIDPVSGDAIAPGDAGYLDAALANRVGVSLSVAENNQQAEFTAELPGGIYAPFLVVDGDITELTDADPSNDPAVYFSYGAANSDNFSHVRVIGDNTYGFEDIVNGGDKDFNDLIVEFEIA